MKITLDLSQLLDKGEITREEYDKLIRLSATQTGSLGFNILIAFGVLAISGGFLALFPSPITSMALGLVIGALGITLGIFMLPRWQVLASISTLLGALLLGGGIVKIAEGSASSFLLMTAVFLIAGVASRSGLLISLAVLSLSSSTGARTGYFHAAYFLGIKEPGITVLLFSVFAMGSLWLSKRVTTEFARLALIASRTSVIVVNFGFWIGSLWGDRDFKRNIVISDNMFSVGWALALLATGVWGVSKNSRWVVNTVAVFGGIHFYTQWFENLGASPGTVVVAGILAISGAVALKAVNQRVRAET